MKNKVVSVYITFLLTVVFLVADVVLFFNHFDFQPLLLNLGYGVFGSSLVSFMICLFEYFNTKRQTLEDFYLSCLSFLNSSRKILWLDVTEEELFLSKLLVKNQREKELISYVKNNNNYYSNKIKGMKDGELLAFIRKNVLDFSLHLKRTLDSYINFLQTDTNNLNRLMGQLFFLNPFTKKKNDIYKSLYVLVVDTINYVNKNSFYFYPYLMGEPVIISEIMKDLSSLNHVFFEKKEVEGVFYVWTKFENKLFDELEKYRCFMYHKKYEPIEHKSAYQSLSN